MLAAGLQRLGHDVSVLCVGRWTEGHAYFSGSETEAYHGVPTTRLHLNWKRAPDPNRYLYDNPVVARFVSEHLARHAPDILHVTSCDRLSASVIPVAKQAGLPVVLSLTDFWFICPRLTLVRSDGQLCDGRTTPWDCLRCSLGSARAYQWPARILPDRALRAGLTAVSTRPLLTRHRGLRGMALNMAERKRSLLDALRMADYLTMATPFGASLFKSLVPDKCIHVTPYGHDLSWLAGYPGKSSSDELRMGFIATLCEAKGPHLLLEAFHRMPAHSAVRLFIYGDLPGNAFGQRLRNLAANDPRVRFCGRYAHERSAEVYSNLDVLVVPSLWYDFPLVAHEALATQTVVVATDLPGMNEIVEHEVTGLLFERGNVDALAGQLSRLAESPSLVARLSGARRQVRDIHDAVGELEGVYSQLVGHMCRCS